jgi:uncharacterized membrane protein
LVSVNLSILGDSTVLGPIRDRSDFRNALERISADAQVDDCLLSAEILWAPETTAVGAGGDEDDGERGSVLTLEDLAANYPELAPL